MHKIFFILPVLLTLACPPSLKYKHDLGFLSSAYANSPESYVTLNGIACKDVEGTVGACFKRLKRSYDLKIDILPKPYAYQFKFTCTNALGVNFSEHIPKDLENSILIPKEKYGNLKVFNCIGRIFPEDRPEGDINTFFEFRVRLIDPDYLPRERVKKIKYRGKKYLVLGKYAYRTKVFKNGRWKLLKKKTSTKAKGITKVISESYIGRLSYYGI